MDELPGLVVDLESEFSGGRDNEDLGALAVILTGSRNILLDEASYGGQQKCRLQRERENINELVTLAKKNSLTACSDFSKFTETLRPTVLQQISTIADQLNREGIFR